MKKILLFVTILLTLFIWLISIENKTKVEGVNVLEVEEMSLLTEFAYGSGSEEVGLIPDGFEKLGKGPNSYFVRKQKIFILDNVNERVVIRDLKSNQTHNINMDNFRFGQDIYVDNKEDLYILDNGLSVVNQYNKNGELLNTHEIPKEIKVPTSLTAKGSEVFVEQAGIVAFSLNNKSKKYNGKLLEGSVGIDIIQKKVDEKNGKIKLSGSKNHEIPVSYDHSFGALDVLSISNNELVYKKTEVAPDVSIIMTETTIEVADFNGKVKGAIRIPIENIDYIPVHMIRVDKNNIYLLSPEKDSLKVFELHPGKKHKKKLKDRVEKYKQNDIEYQKKVTDKEIEEKVKDLERKLEIGMTKGEVIQVLGEEKTSGLSEGDHSYFSLNYEYFVVPQLPNPVHINVVDIDNLKSRNIGIQLYVFLSPEDKIEFYNIFYVKGDSNQVYQNNYSNDGIMVSQVE
ncbi:hypothetical protein [Bacillus solimangrovi]|uniref:Uncharacterized protein n=1 Tax=Bacillus solimangrovi TaxID=1305675 RepID=A0A1E5LKA3_9BACI|nr:hypothetical protein [Bacillus solimangrovi]OEH94520.1 hypothetical protein BFG57_07565 [Bacillus solimangrovi]